MTRQEFLDTVNEFDDLIVFCDEEGCDYCEGIYSADGREDRINELLSDWEANWGWRDIMDFLRDEANKDGYAWYVESDGTLDGLTDEDFERYKSDVLSWMDDGGYWDDPDEPGVEDDDEWTADYIPSVEPQDPEDLIPVETEDCSMTELFSAGVNCIRAITCEEIQKAKEADRDFFSFVW